MNSPKRVNPVQKAYNDLAYQVTKAILTPVMGAIGDTLHEQLGTILSDTISESIQRGAGEALQKLGSQINLWDLFLGKKN